LFLGTEHRQIFGGKDGVLLKSIYFVHHGFVKII
jgi:hypothetical protein